jgi:sulfide:quinone oxidoreductase
MKNLIPKGVEWIQDLATGINPEVKTVSLRHETIQYDKLVIATGLQLQWGRVKGLIEAIHDDASGVISVCSFTAAQATWKKVKHFFGGKIISAMPTTETKCPGVPQKVLFLMRDILKRVKGQGSFAIFSPNSSCAIDQTYRQHLEGELVRMGTEIHYNAELLEVRAEERIAVFSVNGKIQEHHYDLLHVVPPMGAPKFLANLANEKGFVSVNPKTLQHTKYADIFAIGDVAGLPTRKTAAAARKQVPVLVKHLIASIKGARATAVYDGYTCCPVPILPGKILMMEFGYKGILPNWLNRMIGMRPSRAMYAIKKWVIPTMYWRIMLRGMSI